MSSAAASPLARRNRRRQLPPQPGCRSSCVDGPVPRLTVADLGVLVGLRREQRRRRGRPIRRATIMLAAERRSSRCPDKIFVQLHDIK